MTEIQKHQIITQRYCSRDRFENVEQRHIKPFTGNLLSEKAFSVNAVLMDHNIDCIGLSLEENYSINIIKEGLQKLELPVGSWLREFKNAIYRGGKNSDLFKVTWKERDKSVREKLFPMDKLIDKIARISPGQKITYITIVDPKNGTVY